MTRPSLLLVAWLLVVVAASAVTWLVIDSTGRDLLTRAAPAAPTVSDGANPRATATPRAAVRSWQGSAGVVAVSCDADAIVLRAASPDDGWSIEVDRRGPREVRVEFESGAEDDRRTEVRSRCSGGVPVFEVDAD